MTLRLRQPSWQLWVTTSRSRLSIAGPLYGLQRSKRGLQLTWRSGTGHPTLKWLIEELHAPLYTLGQPLELAISQCTRQAVAALILDMIRRGEAALDEAPLPETASPRSSDMKGRATANYESKAGPDYVDPQGAGLAVPALLSWSTPSLSFEPLRRLPTRPARARRRQAAQIHERPVDVVASRHSSGLRLGRSRRRIGGRRLRLRLRDRRSAQLGCRALAPVPAVELL